MKVTLLLADYAQEVNGKLYIVGGGWSITGSEGGPLALTGKIEVPWDQANRQHHIEFILQHEDGQPVRNEAGSPVRIEGDFEVGRPPGLKAGTPIDMPFAFNIARPKLEPFQRYEWRLKIDGDGQPDWHVSFSTRK